MSHLVDTHTFAWAFLDDAKLSPAARAVLENTRNEIFVSTATAWEIAIKVGIGRWPQARSLLDDFEGLLQAEGFRLLPATVAHVRYAGLMRGAHRDPFDRLLAAQATTEGLTIITADPELANLGAACLW